MPWHPVSRDHRYTIERQNGEFVVLFDGERVGASRFYQSAVVLAVGDHARRNGAAIITAVD